MSAELGFTEIIKYFSPPSILPQSYENDLLKKPPAVFSLKQKCNQIIKFTPTSLIQILHQQRSQSRLHNEQGRGRGDPRSHSPHAPTPPPGFLLASRGAKQ